MVSSTSSSDAANGDGDDVVARLHDLTDREVFEIEHAMDHILL
jgi:hypothetical protein